MSHPLSTRLTLASSRNASFHMQQGSEVFCRHGQLQLLIAPMTFTDHGIEQIMWLGTGQSWRAPANTCIQLMAVTDTAGAEIQNPAEQQIPPSCQVLGTKRLWVACMDVLSARLRQGFARLRRERRAV